MATSSTSTTTIAETRETSESSVTEVLDNPAKTSPTTGSTGAPQPTTLHGPVDRPSTPASALSVPPAAAGADAPAAHPHGAPFEPERDVETDEQRRDDESHDVGAVHREAPLRLAIRPVGGEPEERDPRQEVELVRPRGGGGEVLGQTA